MPVIVEAEGGIGMDTTASLNAAMRYIERRLFDIIDFTEVEKITQCH